ncbi:MAG: hypothetical protein PHF54_02640 [Candidatus Pacebacteria bacterium]|jgi:hypothetical protein|nr:hypothetical protein [Candidatus Paceibacterota bacterium]
MAEDKNDRDDMLRGIDMGITRGGAKESVLQDHFYSRRKLADLICNVEVPLDFKRVKAMVLLHAAGMTNEHMQNEIRDLIDEKFREEMEIVRKEFRLANWQDVPVERQQEVMLDVCLLVEGLVTKYMDQFIGLEDHFEVMLG